MQREWDFFIDNLLVRIHLIWVDRPCAIGVWIPFPRKLYIYLPSAVSIQGFSGCEVWGLELGCLWNGRLGREGEGEEDLPASRDRVLHWQSTGANLLNHRDDFSGLALRHVPFFPAALHIPSLCGVHARLSRTETTNPHAWTKGSISNRRFTLPEIRMKLKKPPILVQI